MNPAFLVAVTQSIPMEIDASDESRALFCPET
jgi:hypothetical protein